MVWSVRRGERRSLLIKPAKRLFGQGAGRDGEWEFGVQGSQNIKDDARAIRN